MRVLMVSQLTPYLPCHDAFRVLPARLLQRLAGRHQLALVTATAPADTPEQRRWAARLCASVETVAVDRWRHPLTGAPAAGLGAMARAVERAIAAFRPDVLHLHGPLVAPLARPGAVPSVLACHESPARRASEVSRQARGPWRRLAARLAERVEREWERRWFPGADACVVLSEEDRAALSAHLPFARIEVIPPGIDPRHHAFRRSGVPGRIVVTGNLGWPPNAEAVRRFATRVFPRLRRELPRAELLVAGPDAPAALRALVRRDGIRLTGAVPDLRPSIWSAAVAVSPGALGAGARHGVLEAMALGTPVIASPASLSGLPDVLPGQHVLVAESDDDLLGATRRVLTEPVLAHTLARNARALVEAAYTWEAVAESWEALAARVAAARAPLGVAA